MKETKKERREMGGGRKGRRKEGRERWREGGGRKGKF